MIVTERGREYEHILAENEGGGLPKVIKRIKILKSVLYFDTST